MHCVFCGICKWAHLMNRWCCTLTKNMVAILSSSVWVTCSKSKTETQGGLGVLAA